jgi:hypothetical protein
MLPARNQYLLITFDTAMQWCPRRSVRNRLTTIMLPAPARQTPTAVVVPMRAILSEPCACPVGRVTRRSCGVGSGMGERRVWSRERTLAAANINNH